jgi:hypothetical protein
MDFEGSAMMYMRQHQRLCPDPSAVFFDSVQLKEITSRDPAILLLYPSTVVLYVLSTLSLSLSLPLATKQDRGCLSSLPGAWVLYL